MLKIDQLCHERVILRIGNLRVVLLVVALLMTLNFLGQPVEPLLVCAVRHGGLGKDLPIEPATWREPGSGERLVATGHLLGKLLKQGRGQGPTRIIHQPTREGLCAGLGQIDQVREGLGGMADPGQIQHERQVKALIARQNTKDGLRVFIEPRKTALGALAQSHGREKRSRVLRAGWVIGLQMKDQLTVQSLQRAQPLTRSRMADRKIWQLGHKACRIHTWTLREACGQSIVELVVFVE